MKVDVRIGFVRFGRQEATSRRQPVCALCRNSRPAKSGSWLQPMLPPVVSISSDYRMWSTMNCPMCRKTTCIESGARLAPDTRGMRCHSSA